MKTRKQKAHFFVLVNFYCQVGCRLRDKFIKSRANYKSRYCLFGELLLLLGRALEQQIFNFLSDVKRFHHKQAGHKLW